MADSGKLGHALLFVEEQGMGAIAFALALSQYINCNEHKDGDSCSECNSCYKHSKLIHPDVHFAFPVAATSGLTDQDKKHPISDYFWEPFCQLLIENPYFDEQELYSAIGLENKSGVISVFETKNIINILSLKPYEGNCNVIIIYLAEKMNAEAANKLLKLLEEPPLGTYFFMICHQPDKLLPTILSRCQVITLQPSSTEEICDYLCRHLNADQDKAMIAARLAKGSYGLAVKLLKEAEITADEAHRIEDILDAALLHDLSKLIGYAEDLAELGRERQKDFCIYAESYIRKIFMFANNAQSVSFAMQKEYNLLNKYASSIKADFYQKALKFLDLAILDIGSNVNSKLVFIDLCNRFYLYI
jgi:DNA polymerase III subunit delta'